jgi:hypothetical protein
LGQICEAGGGGEWIFRVIFRFRIGEINYFKIFAFSYQAINVWRH